MTHCTTSAVIEGTPTWNLLTKRKYFGNDGVFSKGPSCYNTEYINGGVIDEKLYLNEDLRNALKSDEMVNKDLINVFKADIHPNMLFSFEKLKILYMPLQFSIL